MPRCMTLKHSATSASALQPFPVALKAPRSASVHAPKVVQSPRQESRMGDIGKRMCSTGGHRRGSAQGQDNLRYASQRLLRLRIACSGVDETWEPPERCCFAALPTRQTGRARTEHIGTRQGTRRRRETERERAVDGSAGPSRVAPAAAGRSSASTKQTRFRRKPAPFGPRADQEAPRDTSGSSRTSRENTRCTATWEEPSPWAPGTKPRLPLSS